MMEPKVAGERRIVRGLSAKRRAVFYALVVVAALTGLVAAFESGRLSAGYSTLDTALERRALLKDLEEAHARIMALETQVAHFEVSSRIDKEANAQIEKSLADLDGRLGEQAQELAFYRSVVSPKDVAPGLRIVRLQILPATQALHYRLRIVLVQGGRPQGTVSGTLAVSVDGQQAGQVVNLPLDLGTPGRKEFAFGLRSFQELEPEIVLPADFVPQRVQLEARPKGAEAPLRETVPWKVDTP
jgi:hypothetical protein